MHDKLQELLEATALPRKERGVLIVGCDSGVGIMKLLREKGFENVKVLTVDDARRDETVMLGSGGMPNLSDLLISDSLVRLRDVQPVLDTETHYPPHGWYRQFERRGRGPRY